MTKHDMMTWIRRASLWWGLGFSLIYIAGIAMAYSRPSGRFHYWLGDINGSIRFVIFNQSDFLDRFVVHTIADGPTPPNSHEEQPALQLRCCRSPTKSASPLWTATF
jgi:hypothetical protein